MSIFSRIFGRKEATTKSSDHAVIVHVPLSCANGTQEEFARLTALELKIEESIAAAGAGELDGNEFGQGDFTYFMYGPNADRLFTAVETILREDSLTRNGYALLRYGPPGSKQQKIKLSD